MSETESRKQKSDIRIAEEVLSKTEELLAVLESDARHIQESLSTLDRLRGLLIKHDETGLQELLLQIRMQADAYAAVESQRQRLRGQVATLLGCPAGDLNLSRLAAALPPAWRTRVTERKKTLRVLTDRLTREHRATSLLLADCIRFNRALFHAVFRQGRAQPATYTPLGKAPVASGSHLMNVQF